MINNSYIKYEIKKYITSNPLTDKVWEALKFDEDLRKLTKNLNLKEENQAYKYFIEVNNLSDKFIPNTSNKFKDKQIRRKYLNKKIYELYLEYTQK